VSCDGSEGCGRDGPGWIWLVGWLVGWLDSGDNRLGRVGVGRVEEWGRWCLAQDEGKL
jgi:hypothetical protein